MRRLELWGDGRLLEARDVRMGAQQRADVIIDDVDLGVGGRRGPARRRPTVRPTRRRRRTSSPPTTAPGPSCRPIDRARSSSSATAIRTSRRRCRYLPNTSLFGVKADRYPADAQRRDGTDWDLIIFEGFVPATLPSTPTLVVAPPRTSPIGTVTRQADEPGHRDAVARRTDPPLRRPLDDPHRRGGAAGAAGLGAIGDPGAAGRAAALRGRPGRRTRAPCSRSSRAGPTCRCRSRFRS